MIKLLKNHKLVTLSILVTIIVVAILGQFYKTNLERRQAKKHAYEVALKKKRLKLKKKRLQNQLNLFTKARFDLLSYYDREQEAIARLQNKKNQYNEAHKKWQETVDNLENDYDAKYEQVRAHNSNVSEYWDYDSESYKRTGSILPYPSYPKMPDEPKFPSFAADVQILEALKASVLENSNAIADLSSKSNEDSDYFNSMKKYMMQLSALLLGQIEDVTRDAKNSPEQFESSEYDVSRLIADIKSLNTHLEQFLNERKLKNENPLKDSKTEQLR